MSDVFDITKVSAERARRGRPPKPKTPELTPVTAKVTGGDHDLEPKMIAIVAPEKPVDTGTFIAPKHMDPLEDAIFKQEPGPDAAPVELTKLPERTLLEQARGQKALSRLR